MRCIIISAGIISDYNEMKKYINDDDYIIAADGGYRHLDALGAACNYVLGDFDSIDNVPVLADEVFSSDKDDTDTMLAIKHGLLKGFDDFVILGGLGGRLDHTIANISSLEYLKSHGAHGLLADESTIVRMVCAGDKVVPMMHDGYFSIFPYGVEHAKISISGVKYPLSRHTLHSDFPLGVSNEITDFDAFDLTIHEGKIMVVECKKD